jgi:hypothetical protein
MKSPERIIVRRLSRTPSVARFLGFRIYPMIVPTSAPLPFATYQRTSIERRASLASAVGIPLVNMSLSIFAASYQQVREIADECRSVLDHIQETSLGVSVSNVTIEDESEDIVQLEGGDLPPAWQVTLALQIEWQEV